MRPTQASSDVVKGGLNEAPSCLLLGGQEKVYVLNRPYGVHMDSSDHLLVADTGWGRVLVSDPKHERSGFLGEDPAGQLSKPACMATDQDGTICVPDLTLFRVDIYDKALKFKRGLRREKRFEQPVGIAIDRTRGRIHVVDALKHPIVRFGADGHEPETLGKRGRGKGEFNHPSKVAVAANGDVYVTGTFNFRMRGFDANGKYFGQRGKVGDLPGTFTRPKDVALDHEGHVHVVEAVFRNVRIFTPEGKLLLFFGGLAETWDHSISRRVSTPLGREPTASPLDSDVVADVDFL